MNVSLYVITHKKAQFPQDSTYKPLLVGKRDDSLGVALSDTTGDSISSMNQYYSELTGHYWIWKNDSISDIVGLCHYRRFLWLKDVPWRIAHKLFPTLASCERYLAPKAVPAMLEGHDVILPRVAPFSCEHVGEQFINSHGQEHYDQMISAIRRATPEYMEALERVLQRRWIYFANILIARKPLFDDYSAWLFCVLRAVEAEVDLKDPKNLRLFGYISERLLNVYVEHHHLKTREVPLINIGSRETYCVDDWYRDFRYLKRRYFPGVVTLEEKVRGRFRKGSLSNS